MVPRGPRGITTGDFGLQCDCIANTTHTRNALMAWTIRFVVGHKHRLREILVLSSFGFIRTSKRNFCSIVRDVCGRIRKLVGGESRAHCGVVVQQGFAVHS